MEDPLTAVRIGGALGYWGDRRDALFDLLRGPLDYVIMDYLAEVTMSILQKQRLRDASLGYPHDFLPAMREALPHLVGNRVRLITDAGGLNPEGLAVRLLEVAQEAGFPDIKVGVVSGDDLVPRLDELARGGIDLSNLDTGAPQRELPGRILSANAYLGAFPIAQALDGGAHIVVTGRVNDAALALGPLIHEFGWKPSDYDLLASGTIAGHLLECGGQASGGNFNGGWDSVPDLANLGFPVAHVAADGSFVMTIHPGKGGLVTPAVLKEQLLYEIGDPSSYIVADVICDITGVELNDLGHNRVAVRGTRGRAPTDTYKVSISCEGGWQVSTGLVYTWPDCVAKARASARLMLQRLEKLGVRYREVDVSLLGYDAVHGGMSHKLPDPNEVYLRMAFATDDQESADRIAREMITHVLCGVPTSCMLEPGRALPHRRVLYWPSLVPKRAVTPRVSVAGGTT